MIQWNVVRKVLAVWQAAHKATKQLHYKAGMFIQQRQQATTLNVHSVNMYFAVRTHLCRTKRRKSEPHALCCSSDSGRRGEANSISGFVCICKCVYCVSCCQFGSSTSHSGNEIGEALLLRVGKQQEVVTVLPCWTM